jgi:hypothetical protein
MRLPVERRSIEVLSILLALIEAFEAFMAEMLVLMTDMCVLPWCPVVRQPTGPSGSAVSHQNGKAAVGFKPGSSVQMALPAAHSRDPLRGFTWP